MTIIEEIPGNREPRFMRDWTLAGHTQPTIPGNEAIEADLVNLVRYRFVAPKLQGNVACVGSTETSSRTVYASTWFPLEVFTVEKTVVG